MHVETYEPITQNPAHSKLRNWLEGAFGAEPGVAYYRYPVFVKSGDNLKEPDFVVFHRVYGLWVIECREFKIGNIRNIRESDSVWEMSDWREEEEGDPKLRAEDGMVAIQGRLESQRALRGKIIYHSRAALPEISTSEWQKSGFDQHRESVWLYEELTPAALRKSIEGVAQENPQSLDEETWDLACKVLGGILPRQEPRSIPTGTPSNSPLRAILEMESHLKALDLEQQKVAFQVPDGPQRLRGLAGTGKTVLLAKRAAKIHIKHPDWTIGFVFFTRSLYDQIRNLITQYCRDLGDRDPDWQRLKVRHSWGGRGRSGFYFDLARSVGVNPLAVRDVINQIGQVGPGKGFEYICLSLVRSLFQRRLPELRQQANYSPDQLAPIEFVTNLSDCEILNASGWIQEIFVAAEENGLGIIPQLYDVLIVDEGQDLPAIFYKLLLACLKEPKRLYWAYDEAQGIGSSIIPDAATVFGRRANGQPRVDVSGSYVGSMSKSYRMYRCYRTPRLLVMVAHALNMGLLRQDGALQGPTDQENWRNLGYTIREGNFRAEGRPVTVTREAEASPHPVDQNDFQHRDSLGDILKYKFFNSQEEEQSWIADQVKRDLETGFRPEDILIAALCGDHEKDYHRDLKSFLERVGVPACIAGIDCGRDTFRLPDMVTIADIFRAKGNEALRVYACRFHCATQPLEWKQETEIQKRNEAFVALTRARVWCIVTGLRGEIFEELKQVRAQSPNLSFPAFNRNSLRRVLDDVDIEASQ